MKARILHLWLPLAAGLCHAVSYVALGADAPATATVTDVRGVAELKEGTNWVSLKPGESIHEGVTLRTGQESELLLICDYARQRIRLENSSEIRVVKLRRGNDSIAETELNLTRGALSAFTPSGWGETRLTITLSNQLVGITRGIFTVSAEGITKLREGSATVVRDLNGQTATLPLQGGYKCLANGDIVPLTQEERDSPRWLKYPSAPKEAVMTKSAGDFAVEKAPPSAVTAAPGAPGNDNQVSGHFLELNTLTASAARLELKQPDQGNPASPRIVPVYYATDRKRSGSLMASRFYGSGRTHEGDPLEYGLCKVTMPTNHLFAHLESYSVFRFETKNLTDKHVTLQTVRPLEEPEFYTSLQNALNDSDNGELFIFIHGYNATWEDSVRRAGQLAYDLGIDKTRGATLLYSWPSRGSRLSYVSDETNVHITQVHLARLLTDLASRSGARRINLLAHSLGNQALMEALHQLGGTMPPEEKPFLDQVIMAAPDVDLDQLQEMFPLMHRTGNHFTLYSCKNDLPLTVSRWFHHDHCRVGSFALVPGMDTIDSTLHQMEGLLHHSYISDDPTVLNDVRKLIASDCPVQNRCCCCLEKRTDPSISLDQPYWAFASNITNCTHYKPCD